MNFPRPPHRQPISCHIIISSSEFRITFILPYSFPTFYIIIARFKHLCRMSLKNSRAL